LKNYLFALSLCLPASAMASNTITFVGEVSDSTCNVTIGGNSGDLMIQLPTVTTTDLSSAGSTAGEKEFTFEVNGCSGTAQTNVGIRLVAPSVSTAGNLINLASVTPATKVFVQILDGSSVIDFTSGEYHSAKKAFASALSFPFKARYYSEGSPTAGAVEAKLEYALSYN
jgi:major type 1 subunit fimbrin (pilin)